VTKNINSKQAGAAAPACLICDQSEADNFLRFINNPELLFKHF
jgi:hypothetical protein